MIVAAPPITVSKLNTGYKSAHILHDVSINVMAGEVVGLVGLNGAGKTTLIKSLLGLLSPFSGDIRLWGENAALPRARKKLAFLPEKFEPADYMTGREYCHFAVKLYGNHTTNSQITAIAERLELSTKALGKRISNYSKGMRQKVGLMSCLLNDAQLLILDEPMSGLDPLARRRLRTEILKCRTEGRAVLMSSHDLHDVEKVCDRVIVIHQGRVVSEGTAAELKALSPESDLEDGYLRVIA